MIEAFRSSMERFAIVTDDRILADGKPHYIRLEGDKPGRKAAWYILFPEGYGSFGCFKTGVKEKWRHTDDDRLANTKRTLSRRATKETREAEAAEECNIARAKANVIWAAATPACNMHPYLIKKGIKNYGLKLHSNRLTLPLRDSAGTLHSLQYIDAEGCKRFLAGGKKKGCFFLIGKNSNTLCIAEGYATAASIHEATGHMVAVAFDAGNLLPAAIALRHKFPNAKIFVCADNDAKTPGNPGLTQACKAAEAIGGFVTFIKET